MKLYLIDHDGWGIRFRLVRARSEEDARQLAGATSGRYGVTELSNERGVIWEYDYSPDSSP